MIMRNRVLLNRVLKRIKKRMDRTLVQNILAFYGVKDIDELPDSGLLELYELLR